MAASHLGWRSCSCCDWHVKHPQCFASRLRGNATCRAFAPLVHEEVRANSQIARGHASWRRGPGPQACTQYGDTERILAQVLSTSGQRTEGKKRAQHDVCGDTDHVFLPLPVSVCLSHVSASRLTYWTQSLQGPSRFERSRPTDARLRDGGRVREGGRERRERRERGRREEEGSEKRERESRHQGH